MIVSELDRQTDKQTDRWAEKWMNGQIHDTRIPELSL